MSAPTLDGDVCAGSELLAECSHAACGFVDCPLCHGLGYLEDERWGTECPRCRGDRSIPADEAVVPAAVQ